MQAAAAGALLPLAAPAHDHHRLLAKTDAVLHPHASLVPVAEYHTGWRRPRPTTASIHRPNAIRSVSAQLPPSLRSGYRRHGVVPRLHQILDQIALRQTTTTTTAPDDDDDPVVDNRLCYECGRICDPIAAAVRQCTCGAVAHGACVHSIPFYCRRWRCQVRARADRLGARLSQTPPARPEPKSTPRKPPPPPPPSVTTPTAVVEYPGAKAWHVINGYFEPVRDLAVLDPSPAPDEDLYRVPAPTLDYRDIWREEDRVADEAATADAAGATPRSVRYRQRSDTTTPATTTPGAADLGATSGRVARASFFVRFDDDGETPVLVRRHGSFRSLDLNYAVASALIQPGECLAAAASDHLQYMFPPPLYDPLTARFFLSGTPAPSDRRPRRPSSSLHFFVERVADDDDPLQDAEDDDEVCCELWLLRRHLEAQIKENNAAKAWLRKAAAAEWAQGPPSIDDSARQRHAVFDAYLNRHKRPPSPKPSSPKPSPSLALVDVTDFDRALTIASQPHACSSFTLDDLCRRSVAPRLVMPPPVPPPIMAAIVDFQASLDEQIEQLIVHELVRSLVDVVVQRSSASAPYTIQDQAVFCSLCPQSSHLGSWFISCDQCESWFHGTCVGLSDDACPFLRQFLCTSCGRRSRRRTVLSQDYLLDRLRAPIVDLSTLRVRIHQRDSIISVVMHDGIGIEIDNVDGLLEAIAPPPPSPPKPPAAGPLRRSQREAAQWATTLNRMRDVDIVPGLEIFTKKRNRSATRIMSRTVDGVTISIHGKRLGRPPKKVRQEQEAACPDDTGSWTPASPISTSIGRKRHSRLR